MREADKKIRKRKQAVLFFLLERRVIVRNVTLVPTQQFFFWQIFFRLFSCIFCISIIVGLSDWRLVTNPPPLDFPDAQKKPFFEWRLPCSRTRVRKSPICIMTQQITRFPTYIHTTEANLFFDPRYWSPSQSLLFYNSSPGMWDPEGGSLLNFYFPHNSTPE